VKDENNSIIILKADAHVQAMEREVGADVEDEEGRICRVPTVCVIGCMLIATYSKLNLIKGLIYKKLLIIYSEITQRMGASWHTLSFSPGFLHPGRPV
jgi:hypothetical protein